MVGQVRALAAGAVYFGDAKWKILRSKICELYRAAQKLLHTQCLVTERMLDMATCSSVRQQVQAFRKDLDCVTVEGRHF
jgi:hypothetical protein